MSAALFPGSFDPPTRGHIDLIQRAAAMFDRVVVAVAVNPEKQPLFTPDERQAMLAQIIQDLGVTNAETAEYRGLTVAAARANGCTVLFRGIRGVTDLEYEAPMAQTNRHLDDGVDTVFVMPAPEWQVCSSRLVREAAKLGGDVSHYVTPAVWAALQERIGPKE
ncbi:MAG: pantetheine-phosphate adenylyltransferase [Planctomycetota bacterium]